MHEQGYSLQGIFSDVASGLNENRRGPEKFLQAAKASPSAVIVEHKDRLARFGFSYLERYFQDFGGSVIVVDHQEKDENQELVEDLIAIATSFSARIYGKRGERVAKRIETVLKEEGERDENRDSCLST
jgi:predicted site-specific integrase-resolvase